MDSGKHLSPASQRSSQKHAKHILADCKLAGNEIVLVV